jgi:hypothetical protein
MDEEQTIGIREFNATLHPSPQHGHLMPERGILCLKSAFRFERGNKQSEQQP